jgi:hypothetical protein
MTLSQCLTLNDKDIPIIAPALPQAQDDTATTRVQLDPNANTQAMCQRHFCRDSYCNHLTLRPSDPVTKCDKPGGNSFSNVCSNLINTVDYVDKICAACVVNFKQRLVIIRALQIGGGMWRLEIARQNDEPWDAEMGMRSLALPV